MKKIVFFVLITTIVLVTLYQFDVFSNKTTFNMTTIKEKIKKTFPDVNQLSTREFKKILDQKKNKSLVLLDVREDKEYETSHIKSAKVSTEIEDAISILQKKPKDTLIVAYCSVGYRSSELAQQLSKRGYTNVYNLEGSIFEWGNNGYPVYREGIKVNEIHPYNKKWGKLLDKSLRSNNP